MYFFNHKPLPRSRKEWVCGPPIPTPHLTDPARCQHLLPLKSYLSVHLYRKKAIRGKNEAEHLCFNFHVSNISHIISSQTISKISTNNLLGSSGRVANSLDFCPASLKSLGCFYFRCILSSQWKVVTVNLQILHCNFRLLEAFLEACSENMSDNKQ